MTVEDPGRQVLRARRILEGIDGAVTAATVANLDAICRLARDLKLRHVPGEATSHRLGLTPTALAELRKMARLFDEEGEKAGEWYSAREFVEWCALDLAGVA